MSTCNYFGLCIHEATVEVNGHPACPTCAGHVRKMQLREELEANRREERAAMRLCTVDS